MNSSSGSEGDDYRPGLHSRSCTNCQRRGGTRSHARLAPTTVFKTVDEQTDRSPEDQIRQRRREVVGGTSDALPAAPGVARIRSQPVDPPRTDSCAQGRDHRPSACPGVGPAHAGPHGAGQDPLAESPDFRRSGQRRRSGQPRRPVRESTPVLPPGRPPKGDRPGLRPTRRPASRPSPRRSPRTPWHRPNGTVWRACYRPETSAPDRALARIVSARPSPPCVLMSAAWRRSGARRCKKAHTLNKEPAARDGLTKIYDIRCP